MGGEEKIFTWAESHKSSVTEAGWSQAIQTSLFLLFSNSRIPINQAGFVIVREGPMSATNTLICGRSFADRTCAPRNWKGEQIGPEICHLPKVNFAACFWACFLVNRV